MGNDCEDEEGKEDVTHMYYTIKCISNYKCTRTENSYIHDDIYIYIYICVCALHVPGPPPPEEWH